MKNKFLCFLTLFILFNSACSASVYDHKTNAKILSKELPVLNNIECKFKQEKILKNLQKPLISGGNFRFDKSQGVFFETTYPVKAVTSYTGKDYEQVNNVIMAISDKQYYKLDKTFDFYYEKPSKIWILGLKPKADTDLGKYIDNITIDGTDYIHKIVITMKDGSTTTQWFWTE